jgi:hypothetical protein
MASWIVSERLATAPASVDGLERTGSVMVYDVTSPTAPAFVTCATSRMGAGGDLGREGLTIVPADESPNGKPLLIVDNEASGTTAIFRINPR